jgi:putative redox protein
MVTASSEQPPYRTRFSNGVFEAFADAIPAKGGGSAGFRPHQLLEAALACCVNMSMRMYADKHAIPLDAATVRVRLDRGAAGAVFQTEIELRGSLTPEQKTRLLEVARACPVRCTLSGPLRFEESAGVHRPDHSA